MLEEKLWKRVARYVKFLRWVPFLRMVAVCNNLAFGKVKDGSDIDLFIVAKKGRLFIVRTVVTAVLHLCGVRRYAKKIEGRFCLSFFVDDSALDLREMALEQDIYLAFWVVSMKPIIDDGVSGEFLAANGWILNYFSDELIKLDVSHSGKLLRNSNGFWVWALEGKFGNWVENRFKTWQLNRARLKVKKASNVASLIVNENVLKFHNIDRRREYRNKWFAKYGETESLRIEKFKAIL